MVRRGVIRILDASDGAPVRLETTPAAMTRLLLLALTVALLSFAPEAFAQRVDRTDRIERRVEVLREAIDLTDEQAAEVRRLFHVQAAERYEHTGDREAHRARMAERHAELSRRIEALLTPEQAQRFRAWREEHKRDRRRDHRQPPNGENVLI